MTAPMLQIWSSGEVRVKVDEGHLPIVLVVELIRFVRLVQVVARAESSDPALAAAFPTILTDVMAYPLVSVASDPLVQMGGEYAQRFAAMCVAAAKEILGARAAAPPS